MRPRTELILMMRPSPRWRIDANMALVARIVPNTLTSNRAFTWLMEDSSAPPNSPRPALLTSTSMRPVCESTAETRALTDASSVTSHVSMATPFEPLLARRRVPKTVNPARASASALALPMPEDRNQERLRPRSVRAFAGTRSAALSRNGKLTHRTGRPNKSAAQAGSGYCRRLNRLLKFKFASMLVRPRNCNVHSPKDFTTPFGAHAQAC